MSSRRGGSGVTTAHIMYRAQLMLVMLAGLTLAVTACDHSTAGAASPRSGGTAVVGVANDAGMVNPDLTTNSPDGVIGCIVYEGLVAARMDGKIDPLLARSWDVSPDGRQYTFHLVNAKWQDGQDFTSADVKYTLLNVSLKYSAILSRVAKDIASIDTPDAHTVVVKLNDPYGPFLLSLNCNSGGAILPEHLFRGTDPTQNPASVQKPVGTGAFSLTDWVRGDHITLSKNPTYWQGLPRLDRIVFKIIPSASSRLLALQSGEVQYLPYDAVQFNDYNTSRSSNKLYLHDELFPPPDDIMFFNVRRAPTSTVQVRQALAYATDTPYLLKTVWFNVGSVGKSSFDSRIAWAYNRTVDYSKQYALDTTKAKSLLDAAGFKPGPDGTRFSLDYVVSSGQQPYVDAGQALKTMWAAVGVNLKLDVVDQNTMVQRVFKDGSFDVTLQGYTTYGDPALGIVRQFVSSGIGIPFANASGYSNPQVDTLAAEGQAAPTQSRRASYYEQIQVIIAKDLPSYILHERTAYDAASKTLHDLWNNHIGYGDWQLAWLE
jgi:peptide/nickel transport system substrate-binding protein